MTRRTLFFLTISLLLAACVRPASTPGLPTVAPTRTKIVRTPVPSPGPDDFCRPADLKTSSNANALGDAVVAGITLTNVTGYACRLSGLPQVTFLDADGAPLSIQYQATGMEQTPPVPATLDLTPGESAIISLVWRNACPPPPDTKISLQLTLSSGETLEIVPKNLPLPPCGDKTQPSIVLIAPYSNPP
jgi:hypothetical protein